MSPRVVWTGHIFDGRAQARATVVSATAAIPYSRIACEVYADEVDALGAKTSRWRPADHTETMAALAVAVMTFAGEPLTFRAAESKPS
jgi:hypothetical protein